MTTYRCRPMAAAVLIALALGGCGSKPIDNRKLAAASLAGQMAAICPIGVSWELFDARAKELGAAPDKGDFRRALAVSPKNIARERWVALDTLGHRTTAWIAEIKPGGRLYKGLLGLGEGTVYKSGIVCAVYDPTITPKALWALTKEWGDHGQSTGAKKDAQGKLHLVRKTWVNASNSERYEDIDIWTPGDNIDEGGMITRHLYRFKE